MTTFTDILSNEWNCSCIGCGLGDGSVAPPGGIVYKSATFVVHQDPEIPIEGFLIITAREHIKSLNELSKNQRYELIDLMNIGVQAIKECNISKEITIIEEERSKHFHVWLFPWHEWMGKAYQHGVYDARTIMKEAKEHTTENDIKGVFNAVDRIKNYFLLNISN